MADASLDVESPNPAPPLDQIYIELVIQKLLRLAEQEPLRAKVEELQRAKNEAEKATDGSEASDKPGPSIDGPELLIECCGRCGCDDLSVRTKNSHDGRNHQ